MGEDAGTMSATDDGPATPGAGLQEAGDAFLEAWEAMDPDAVAGFFDENARAAWAEGSMLEGREAVRDALRAAFAADNAEAKGHLEEVHTYADGSLGYTIAEYKAPIPEPFGARPSPRGRYVALWHRTTAGDWKVLAHTSQVQQRPS